MSNYNGHSVTSDAYSQEVCGDTSPTTTSYSTCNTHRGCSRGDLSEKVAAFHFRDNEIHQLHQKTLSHKGKIQVVQQGARGTRAFASGTAGIKQKRALRRCNIGRTVGMDDQCSELSNEYPQELPYQKKC